MHSAVATFTAVVQMVCYECAQEEGNAVMWSDYLIWLHPEGSKRKGRMGGRAVEEGKEGRDEEEEQS